MTAPESGTAAPPVRPVRRHGPADPVKILMHRHRSLCEEAVDPLEIAAGLEAHGVTDRAAARFRHRDVFSLAEELYARVPRADGPECRTPEEPADAAEADPEPPDPAPAPRSRTARGAVQLLPGAIGLSTVAAHVSVLAPTPRLLAAVDAAGLLLTVLALRLALRHGPLRLRRGPGSRTAATAAFWTVAYAVLGDWLLAQLRSGGPDVPGPLPRAAVATAVALACALAPAAGCAHWFARRARHRVAASRALAELASRVRPLLVAATLLFLGAAAALAAGAHVLLGRTGSPGGRWAVPAAAALAVLLFLARLLAVHGFPAAAAAGLGSAAALEAVALALVLTARLPGWARLGAPVEALVGAAGPAAVPAVACTAAALGLLVHGLRALTGACANLPVPPRREGRTGDDATHRHAPLDPA
ncbi:MULTISPECIES: hypothetical protein [unclassified Streptomyces]|uniref:hypothetical protein n=1 Tax=unclassified Streptomyces TaxID=2593676 RepID=UPI0003826C22|nr:MULTISPECIES: hypothetical protein [unclassified Streptomyces]